MHVSRASGAAMGHGSAQLLTFVCFALLRNSVIGRLALSPSLARQCSTSPLVSSILQHLLPRCAPSAIVLSPDGITSTLCSCRHAAAVMTEIWLCGEPAVQQPAPVAPAQCSSMLSTTSSSTGTAMAQSHAQRGAASWASTSGWPPAVTTVHGRRLSPPVAAPASCDAA